MSEKKNKGKIIYMTDMSRNTGFGKVGNDVCIALANEGYEVFLLAWGFRASEPMQRENYWLLPCGQGAFGEDVLGNYLVSLKPEILITQADTRMISWIPEVLKQIPNKPVWINYPVIDGNTWDAKNTNKKWPSNWSEIIKAADKVVAMTDFSKDIMKANNIDSTTIYHGVNTQWYKPIPVEAKKEVRKNAGLPENGFVVGGVFKNMQRKNPQQYLQAFKLFLDKVPEDERANCVLLLHTQPQPGRNGGAEFDLIQHAVDYGIPQKNVAFSAGMLPPQSMPLIFQVCDVYLQLGGMEGFCLPLAEAMACGLPIIALDSSTHPELLGGTGLISKCPTFKGHPNARVTYGSYNGVECDIVNPFDVAEQLFKLYQDKTLREKLGLAASERAAKVFDVTAVSKQWVDLVNSLVVTEEQIPDEWKKLYEETKV